MMPPQSLAERTFQSCSTAAFWVNRGGQIVEANRAAEILTGLTAERLLQTRFDELCLGGVGEPWETFWLRSERERPARLESKLSTPALQHSVAIEITADRVAGPDSVLYASVADIRHRKRAGQDLGSAESIQQSIMESSTDSILLVAPDEKILFINRTAEGIKPESVIGTSPCDYVHEKFRPRMRECFQSVLQTAKPSGYEVDLMLADGTVCIYDARVAPVLTDARVTGLTIVARDITKEKSAEEALRKSERSLEQAQEIAGVGSWEYDLTTGNATGSRQLLRILGLNEDESVLPVESFINDFIHPEDRNAVSTSHDTAITDQQVESLEFRVICRDERIRHVRVQAEMVFGDEMFPQKIIGTLQDITEQKRVELALRESEEKFRVLTEQSPASVFIVQSERIIYCNDMFSRATGYAHDEILGMGYLEFVHPDYRELVAKRHHERISGGNPPHHYEIRIVTKDGQPRWFDLSAQQIDFRGQSAALITCVNISERKESEEQLREMESQLTHVSRLSTMGEMVAGIAHEINQPLSAIANFSMASKSVIEASDWESDCPVESWLNSVNQQAVRCGDIIRRLRHFVRKSHGERERVDIDRIVRETVALIRSDLRYDSVAIRYESSEPSPWVLVNNVQMQQVLVNLLRNACDAVCAAESPEVTVRTQNVFGKVSLAVEDNGPGIADEQAQKIFDPFFTTKHEGMGMGLAISRSIIESHDGSLFFESRQPTGTTFIITLPDAAIMETRLLEQERKSA